MYGTKEVSKTRLFDYNEEVSQEQGIDMDGMPKTQLVNNK